MYNIVFEQLLSILEGMLPPEEPVETGDLEAVRNPLDKKFNEAEIVKIYSFCLAWSVGMWSVIILIFINFPPPYFHEQEHNKILCFTGSLLEGEDRIKLDVFLRNSEINLPLPNCGAEKTIFDFVIVNDKWVEWSTKVGDCTLPENYVNDFSSIMVPNLDSVRTNFLMDTVIKQVGQYIRRIFLKLDECIEVLIG